MQALKGLEAKAKDHHQGQGLEVSRPRSWILALRTKAKAKDLVLKAKIQHHCERYEKIAFRLIRRFILETIQDRAMVTMAH